MMPLMTRLFPLLLLTLAACAPSEPPLLIDDSEPATSERAADDTAEADADDRNG